MQYIVDVSTVCLGQAASWAHASAGAAGKRYCLPNSRIMLHQPSGGFQGQASDIEIHAREILNLRKRLNKIYVKHTGQDYETIEAAVERDNFMSAEDAKDFGLIDKVETARADEEEVAAAGGGIQAIRAQVKFHDEKRSCAIVSQRRLISYGLGTGELGTE